MSARTKINAIIVQSVIGIAALIGGVCRSWTVFIVTALVLIALALYAGDIRPGSGR